MSGEEVPTLPLLGRRILVTRRPEQAGSLTEPLRALGATVVEVPLIEIKPPLDGGPLDRAVAGLVDYDWLVFTSANAAAAVAERRARLGLQGPLPKVAVVGPATREAFETRFPGLRPDLEPAQSHRAEGLLEAFASWDVTGRRFLIPCSDKARDLLASGLRASGALVDSVVAYRTVAPDGLETTIRGALSAGVDLVVFASPSAVEGFLAAARAAALGVRAAVIGPVTEDAARRAGLEVAVVAAPSTAAGLVACILASGPGCGCLDRGTVS